MSRNGDVGGETAESSTHGDHEHRDPRESGVGRACAREAILDQLEDAIDEAHRKVTSGRVRDAEKEKVRQQWIKTLSYAATSYRQLLRDQDLDELRERVERVEARQDGSAGGELLIDGDEWGEGEGADT